MPWWLRRIRLLQFEELIVSAAARAKADRLTGRAGDRRTQTAGRGDCWKPIRWTIRSRADAGAALPMGMALCYGYP